LVVMGDADCDALWHQVVPAFVALAAQLCAAVTQAGHAVDDHGDRVRIAGEHRSVGQLKVRPTIGGSDVQRRVDTAQAIGGCDSVLKAHAPHTR
jgi:hypothetical protein